MLFNLFTRNVYSTVSASLLGAKFCFSGDQTTSSKQQKLVGEGVKKQGYEAGSHPGVTPLCLPDFSRQRTPGRLSACGWSRHSAEPGQYPHTGLMTNTRLRAAKSWWNTLEAKGESRSLVGLVSQGDPLTPTFR